MTHPTPILPDTIDGIVCLSPDVWGEVKRPQQLMTRLAERAPVVYVEPAASFASLVRHPARELSSGRARWSRALSGRPEELAPGVHVVTPLAAVPPHHRGALGARGLQAAEERFARHSLEQRVRDAILGLGLTAPALWVSEPLSLDGLDGLCTTLVYDCVDRWTDFPGPTTDDAWRNRVVSAERHLLADADVVFCSADGLYAAKAEQAVGRVSMLRNAADVGHFAPAGRAVPRDLASLPGPVVGYIGAIAEWVDLALVRDIARLRPGWSVVLVGPAFSGAISGDSAGLALLEGVPNVHLLGARPYEDVPAYLEAFDVSIIPFKLNGLTEDTNPIKLYEYLAAGKPVVSTPLPEAAAVDGVLIAETAEAFVAAVHSALADSDPAAVERRRSIAEENSWEVRARDAWGVLCGEAVTGPTDLVEFPVDELAAVQVPRAEAETADSPAVQLLPAPRQVGRWSA
jgi:glycosyltransferase involved in cell wall biosynthesis